MATEGISYFRLGCHTNEDMAELEAEFGVKAFAIIVRLWQKIYAEKGYYCEWKERSPLLFLAKYFGGNSGVDLNLIKMVVSRAIKLGIFDEGMYQAHSILTSAEIQEFYIFATKRRSGVNLKNDYLLVSVRKSEKCVNKSEENVCKNEKNANKNRQSKVKVKENKVKDFKNVLSEENPPTCGDQNEETHRNDVAHIPTKEGKVYIASETDLIRWHSLYPDVDIAWEFRKMLGWVAANEKRKKTYSGMRRFVNSWLARAQQGMIDAKAPVIKKNSFSNFEERKNDMDELERKLLGLDTVYGTDQQRFG